MKVMPLGTGSALSTERYHTNFLVESASGMRLLVDCGYTAWKSMHDIGLSFGESVDGVVLTHLHGDHVLGMERLAIETHIVRKKRIPLWIPKDLEQPLWEHTLKGVLGGTWKDRATGKTREKELYDYFDVRTLQVDEPEDVLGMSMVAFDVPHLQGKSTYGYLLQEGADGNILMLTPDARLKNSTYMHVYGEIASVIFHDCFSREPKLPSHTALSELKGLPEEIQKKLYLIHFDDGELEEGVSVGALSVAKTHTWYEV